MELHELEEAAAEATAAGRSASRVESLREELRLLQEIQAARRAMDSAPSTAAQQALEDGSGTVEVAESPAREPPFMQKEVLRSTAKQLPRQQQPKPKDKDGKSTGGAKAAAAPAKSTAAAPMADANRKQTAPPKREKDPSELESLGPPPSKKTATGKVSGQPVECRTTSKQPAPKPGQDKAKQQNKENEAEGNYSYYSTDEEEGIMRSKEHPSSKGSHKGNKGF
jgi:hypothetical protein